MAKHKKDAAFTKRERRTSEFILHSRRKSVTGARTIEAILTKMHFSNNQKHGLVTIEILKKLIQLEENMHNKSTQTPLLATKFLYIIAIFFACALSPKTWGNEVPPAPELTLHIDGIKKEVGSIRVAIFNHKDTWLKKPVLARVLPARSSLEFIQKLPAGEYAIAVFHDKNGNGEMDRNFIGLPKEPYGFSNNARGTFGPPKWKKAKVSISEQNFALNIKIK